MKPEDAVDVLLIFLVALLIVVVFGVLPPSADPDLWGHVRFGQDILRTHAIPRHDAYSFTSDRPWVNHEWLAEVIMAGAYNAAGSAGLIALRGVVAAGALLVLWRALTQAGVLRPVAAGLLLFAPFGVCGLFLTVRPQLFSLLLFAALLALLNGVGRGRQWLLVWTPVLFAVWANTHGGWIVGLGVLGLWSATAFLARTISWRLAVAVTLLGTVGTLATPYGLELWIFLWETVGLGRADITEWQPLTIEPLLMIPWAATALLLVLAWRRCGWTALPQLLPGVALGILSFRVSRLAPFFALTNVILLAPCFATLGPKRLPLSRRPTRADVAIVGGMCMLGVVAAGVAVKAGAECLTIPESGVKRAWTPEAEAVTFLQTNPIEGRLLNYFDYGELAIWHFAPRLSVSYDGRRETVYSEAVQQAHRNFYSKTPDVGFANRLKADYIWLPRRLAVIDLLLKDGWVAIFRGAESVVLARQAGPYVQPPPWAGPRCFPGP